MKVAERRHRKTTYGPRAQFTQLELEVIDFLCAGMTAKEIAEEVGKSTKCVERVLFGLRRYTGALNSHGFVAWCFRSKAVECERCS